MPMLPIVDDWREYHIEKWKGEGVPKIPPYLPVSGGFGHTSDPTTHPDGAQVIRERPAGNQIW